MTTISAPARPIQKELSLPPLPTGPNEVRAYLTHVLISKHDATPELAQQIASNWGLGRPGDLRLAGESYFDQVFGSEVGKFLFRTVQEDIRTEWYASVPGLLSHWMSILSVVSSVFLLVRAFQQSSSKGMIAYLRYASLAFGPPMLFCGVLDEYSSFQFSRVFWGGNGSFLAFFLHLVHFWNLWDERRDKSKVEKKDA